MNAFISLDLNAFLSADPVHLVQRLAVETQQRYRGGEPAEIRAWRNAVDALQAALGVDGTGVKRVLLEFELRRLRRRIDAVLLTEGAIIVVEFKEGTQDVHSACRQAEDYALDLHDFHAGSRGHQIIPVVVMSDATKQTTWPMPFSYVASPIVVAPCGLGEVLRTLNARGGCSQPIDATVWEHAAYHPVPGIVDAARMLYARHGVRDIATAHADAVNLTLTTDAIRAAISDARSDGSQRIIFVTGIPGAGKTLCGLNVIFGEQQDAGGVFLTGNPTLVHVLREALARDAGQRDRDMRQARQEAEKAIQALPAFRDEYASASRVPAERVIVIDEAQRCWSADYAIRKSRDRAVQLSNSEAGHMLDAMSRHDGWAVIVCLVGGGQEIHTGEGGLAAWSEALMQRTHWKVIAAPTTLVASDPRQKLSPELVDLTVKASLDLAVPVRSIRSPDVAPWVNAVLVGDRARAAEIAGGANDFPVYVTRYLPVLKKALRDRARGERRAGLIASSGARRLRAEGLGVEVPHMDAGAVARWFLDRWPDVRASDALEVTSTEFSCQGLELDFVGLCWGGDLVRMPGRKEWLVRKFSGTRWTIPKGDEAIANQINTYRVLLTRARYDTIIWVPPGDTNDTTRLPPEMDAIADYLMSCGARALDDAVPAIFRAAPELV